MISDTIGSQVTIHNWLIKLASHSTQFTTMETRDNITPPEIKPTGKRGGFWKQFGMLVFGTTVSLVLTFGTAQIIQKQQRAKDRRLTALMVMSNIETFVQQLDSAWVRAAHADTATAWLLNIPKDSLDVMEQDELLPIIAKAMNINYIYYDKSTENIFSNNIETWKNMGNFQFIDMVGKSFSLMHLCEEKWNNIQEDISNTFNDIASHPDQYQGNTRAAKIARDPGMRQKLLMIHSLRTWARFNAETLRYYNRKNMKAVDITEQELMEFMEKRQQEIIIDQSEPNYADFNIPKINPDSLTTY